jgi:hypothetical protein
MGGTEPARLIGAIKEETLGAMEQVHSLMLAKCSAIEDI